MTTHAKPRTYEGVSRAAWELARQETVALDKIEDYLLAGDSEHALAAMRDFFGHKKPCVGVRLYDTEDRKQAV